MVVQAKLAGQQKMRWLLVNLQDSGEFASQILNRDVWSDFHVKELIKTHFVFMQVCHHWCVVGFSTSSSAGL